VRGYQGKKTRAEICVRTKSSSYDIGLRERKNTYEVVADWYCVCWYAKAGFLNGLKRACARSAVLNSLEPDRVRPGVLEGGSRRTDPNGPQEDGLMRLQEIEIVIEEDGLVNFALVTFREGRCHAFGPPHEGQRKPPGPYFQRLRRAAHARSVPNRRVNSAGSRGESHPGEGVPSLSHLPLLSGGRCYRWG